MKKAPDFASIFADHLKEYADFMKNSGRKFGVETTILRSFDRYICENNISEITEVAVMEFTYSISGLGNQQYDKRHRIVRKFNDYMNLRNQGQIVRPLPSHNNKGRHIPHIYTENELTALLENAKQLNPVPTLRPYTFYTLLGLLASTGMRVSEAINLDISETPVTGTIDLSYLMLKFQWL